MLNRNTFPVFLLLCLCTACTNNRPEQPAGDSLGSEECRLRIDEGEAEAYAIEIDKIRKQSFTLTTQCSGIILADAKKNAMVSAPMHGFISSIQVSTGGYVSRGQILASLSHPDYIRLQLEYLESKSQYEYFREDFKRQGVLSLEQANSLKVMQQSQNEFRKTEARLKALELQLAFLGIEADSISADNYQTMILLRAPINGYITRIDASAGMFCPEEKPIFFIAGQGAATAILSLNSSSGIEPEPGKHFILSFPEKSVSYDAVVKSATPVREESGVMKLEACIQDYDFFVNPGNFEKAELSLLTDSIHVLPSDAVITMDQQEYLFQFTGEQCYNLIKITSGMKSENMTEIRDLPEELIGSYFVTGGAGNLKGLLINKK